jgi:hypothetical protein
MKAFVLAWLRTRLLVHPVLSSCKTGKKKVYSGELVKNIFCESGNKNAPAAVRVTTGNGNEEVARSTNSILSTLPKRRRLEETETAFRSPALEFYLGFRCTL